MKEFINYIPGFRSNKIWKKIIATIYYFIALLGLFDGIGMFLFLLGMPFIVFSIADVFKSRKANKPSKTAILTLIISLVVTSIGFAMIEPAETNTADKEEPAAVEEVSEDEPKKVKEVEKEPEEPEEPKKETFQKARDLKVHYIDVGQGDSILIQLPNGQTMLIDGGPGKHAQIVIDYLKEEKVEKIDYLVATHPHEDHIGGLPSVVNSFDIDKIYMPNKTHTTKAFEDLLLAIQNKDKKITIAKAGDLILDKEGLSVEILAPEENLNDDNLNNNSIVLKLVYENNSFLFTGDIEAAIEQSIVNKGYNIKSDVLKIAHHGSNTSTANEFLNKANPKYAVITCGKGNQYDHPHQATIDKLEAKNIEIYRTDLDGIIIATSDGEKITFEKKASTVKENAPPKTNSAQRKETTQKKSTQSDNKQSSAPTTSPSKESSQKSEPKPPITDNVEEVYITNTGSKYHRGSCGSLSKSKIPISLKEAKNQGYEPCKRCSPPQ